MSEMNFDRRRFLRRSIMAGSAILLSGCDVLDEASALDHPVRDAMESANALTYRLQRLLFARNALAREYSRADVRQAQRPNGVTAPPDADYRALAADGFAGYRLDIGGMVENPMSFDLAALTTLPARSQITRHDCVEGWSCIAEWTGVPLWLLLDQVRPRPEAKYVLFRCYDTIEQGLSGAFKYYETIDFVDARHPQTILAYGLNGGPLPVENGAPLRLRVERQLGYKMAKYVRSIELIGDFSDIEGGRGGYWEDRGYDWYAGI